MSDLFVFGTLRHLPLLAAVTGRPEAALPAVSARFAGHATCAVAGEDFPMLVARPGAEAEGFVLEGLSAIERARIEFYEGAFDYGLRDVTVETDDGMRHALAYFTDAPGWRPEGLWSLADWVARWGEIVTRAATEEMRRFGRADAPWMPRSIARSRAWAGIMAREGAPQTVRSDMSRGDVGLLRRTGGYDGFFRLERFRLQYRHFDGGDSETVERESFVAFDAALVLPYDPDRDLVLLTEQLRYGPLLRGDPAPWVLEPVAGLVDAGEDPVATARREAEEEAHVTLREVLPMAGLYPSAGYSTEFFHMFLGLCDLIGRESHLAGLDAEHEDIRVHVLPFERAMALIDSGEVNVGATATMLLWLDRWRRGQRGHA